MAINGKTNGLRPPPIRLSQCTMGDYDGVARILVGLLRAVSFFLHYITLRETTFPLPGVQL